MYSRINMDYDKISIDGFPDYYVDKCGNVYSNKRGNMTLRKPSTTKCGYFLYSLCKNGKRHYEYGHRLVATTFVENPRPDIFTEIDHIDGDKTNNAWTNLRWVPSWFNTMYGRIHQRQVREWIDPKSGQLYYQVNFHKSDGEKTNKTFKNREDAEVFNNKIKDYINNWDGFKAECQERPDFAKLFLD